VSETVETFQSFGLYEKNIAYAVNHAISYEFVKQYRRNWKEHIDRSSDMIPRRTLKYQPEGKNKFEKTSEMVEGFCAVISITGLHRPITGKDDLVNVFLFLHIKANLSPQVGRKIKEAHFSTWQLCV
jgi:hypothetical protein